MAESSTSIIVVGAAGRMGSRIAALAQDDPRFALVACVVRDGSSRDGEPIAARAASRSTPPLVLTNPRKALENPVSCHCVIDFSSDAAVLDSIAIARAAGASMLIGTTALSERSVAALRDESRHRAVLHSANTSLGVAVTIDLVARACRLLGDGYHCSIVEAHHIAKKDAPSGTALRIADAVRHAGHTLNDDQILAMRGGDVVGEHTIRLAGAGEYLEVTHRATTRDLFARGALHCAAWLRDRSAGWYTMNDVLGLPVRS